MTRDVSDNRIDLESEIKTLCAKLGIDYERCAEITLEPNSARAIVYTLNENGSKFINDEGGAAVQLHRFRIRS